MQDAHGDNGLTLPGFRIVRNLGVVRGITVRSRSIVETFRRPAITVRRHITIYTNPVRAGAVRHLSLMCEHAEAAGRKRRHCDALRRHRTDGRLTEVLCYGTASSSSASDRCLTMNWSDR